LYNLPTLERLCPSPPTNAGESTSRRTSGTASGYRIVEPPSHVTLFPVDEDPLEGLREAVGDAFEGESAGALKERARESITEEVEAEADEREAKRTD
jgi:hypothetical protein